MIKKKYTSCMYVEIGWILNGCDVVMFLQWNSGDFFF